MTIKDINSSIAAIAGISGTKCKTGALPKEFHETVRKISHLVKTADPLRPPTQAIGEETKKAHTLFTKTYNPSLFRSVFEAVLRLFGWYTEVTPREMRHLLRDLQSLEIDRELAQECDYSSSYRYEVASVPPCFEEDAEGLLEEPNPDFTAEHTRTYEAGKKQTTYTLVVDDRVGYREKMRKKIEEASQKSQGFRKKVLETRLAKAEKFFASEDKSKSFAWEDFETKRKRQQEGNKFDREIVHRANLESYWN